MRRGGSAAQLGRAGSVPGGLQPGLGDEGSGCRVHGELAAGGRGVGRMGCSVQGGTSRHLGTMAGAGGAAAG